MSVRLLFDLRTLPPGVVLVRYPCRICVGPPVVTHRVSRPKLISDLSNLSSRRPLRLRTFHKLLLAPVSDQSLTVFPGPPLTPLTRKVSQCLVSRLPRLRLLLVRYPPRVRHSDPDTPCSFLSCFRVHRYGSCTPCHRGRVCRVGH